MVDADRYCIDLMHQLARVRSLSPLATLERGYAVLQDADGHVVTGIDQARPDQEMHVRVRDGRVHVVVRGTEPDPALHPAGTGETTGDTPSETQENA